MVGLGCCAAAFFFGFCGGFPLRLQSGLSMMVSPPLGMSDESRAIPPPLFFLFPAILFFFVCGSPGSHPAGHPAGVWMGVVSTHICEEGLSAVFSG